METKWVFGNMVVAILVWSEYFRNKNGMRFLNLVVCSCISCDANDISK